MKFLVIKLADLGDVLTATPALRALRETYPDAGIDLLTAPAGRTVLERSALIDSVLTFDKFAFDRIRGSLGIRSLAGAAQLAVGLRGQRYDRVLLFHHLTTRWGALKFRLLISAIGSPSVGLDNGRGGFLTKQVPDHGFGTKHEVEYWLEVVGLLGATTADHQLDLPPSSSDDLTAMRLLPDTVRPAIAIHAGSGGYSLARRWPIERFVEVARRVSDAGFQVVAVGGETDLAARVAAVGGIDLSGKTTVGELAAVLRRCAAFVGNDSGVMHLAAAAGTPIVAIFGPSNAAAWGPWNPGGTSCIVRENMACSPCFYRGFSLGTPEGCTARSCLERVTVDRVVNEIYALVGNA